MTMTSFRLSFLAGVLGTCVLPLPGRAEDLLVSLTSEPAVRRFDGSGSLLSSLTIPGVGGGTMRGMTIGADGNLYVSYSTGSAASRIARFNGTTYAYIDTFVSAGAGGLTSPVGLTFGPGGDLFVVDAGSANVKRYNGLTGAPLGDVFAPLLGGLTTPQDIIYKPGIGLLVSDIAFIGKVNRYDISTGSFIDVFISSPELDSASEMIQVPGGGILVSSFDNSRVLLYDGVTGDFAGIVVESGAGGLSGPRGLAFDDAGHLLVTSQFTDHVLRYSYPSGAPLGVAATLGFSDSGEFLLTHSIPEPAAVSLLCIGGLMGIARRRRPAEFKPIAS